VKAFLIVALANRGAAAARIVGRATLAIIAKKTTANLANKLN